MGYSVEIGSTRRRKGKEHAQSRFPIHVGDIVMLIEKAQSLGLKKSSRTHAYKLRHPPPTYKLSLKHSQYFELSLVKSIYTLAMAVFPHQSS